MVPCWAGGDQGTATGDLPTRDRQLTLSYNNNNNHHRHHSTVRHTHGTVRVSRVRNWWRSKGVSGSLRGTHRLPQSLLPVTESATGKGEGSSAYLDLSTRHASPPMPLSTLHSHIHIHSRASSLYQARD
ncbi:hypothetical protein E2C01_033329 [Portunus trituberculatus]|uniref:Uncharacterized protein n=1 Tax=Portunus trituberculatus TaxID=210409 RepID=A0A5B7EXK5_PORTR|nr:hypothetical protein [Portunus trituberculatus]